jgi:hypothetical protein
MHNLFFAVKTRIYALNQNQPLNFRSINWNQPTEYQAPHQPKSMKRDFV